jgi:hypothetical protein
VRYKLKELMLTGNFGIAHDIQHRELHPFTMGAAARFFSRFDDGVFECDKEVGFIEIFDGKENCPEACYAAGWLYSQPWRELVALEDQGKKPEPHGKIQFEYADSLKIAPRIEVSSVRGSQNQQG